MELPADEFIEMALGSIGGARRFLARVRGDSRSVESADANREAKVAGAEGTRRKMRDTFRESD